MTERIKDFSLGKIRVFPTRNLIRSDVGDFPLEPRIMEVLVELSQHSRDVLTRTHLVNELWSIEFGGDESLTRSISQLRKTFKAAGLTGDFIQTIPKRGYRLILTPDYTPLKTKSSVPRRGHTNFQNQKTVSYQEAPAPAETLPSSGTRAQLSKVVPPKDIIDRQSSASTQAKTRLIVYSLTFLLAGIISFSTWYNFYGNRLSPNAFTLGTSSRISSDTVSSSQAELGIAIIFTYLNGQINQEQAIQNATPHIRLAQSNPTNLSTAFTAKGWLAVLQLRDADALSSFDNAILKDPLQAKAWLGKAYVFHQREDYALALSMVDQAINIDALTFFSRLLRLNILVDMGEPATAKDDLEQLTAIHGDHPELELFQKMLKDID